MRKNNKIVVWNAMWTWLEINRGDSKSGGSPDQIDTSIFGVSIFYMGTWYWFQLQLKASNMNQFQIGKDTTNTSLWWHQMKKIAYIFGIFIGFIRDVPKYNRNIRINQNHAIFTKKKLCILDLITKTTT